MAEGFGGGGNSGGDSAPLAAGDGHRAPLEREILRKATDDLSRHSRKLCKTHEPLRI